MVDGTVTTRIDEYFSAISSWSGTYKNPTLTYFGIDIDGVIELCTARLRLGFKRALPDSSQRIGRMHIGTVSVRKISPNAAELVHKLARGESIQLPDGRQLRLSASADTAAFIPPANLFHPEGLNSGRRLSVLEVLGGRVPDGLSQPAVDWDLKAARRPYDGLAELLTTHQLRSQLGDRRTLEVVGHTPIEVLLGSKVDGEYAEVGLWLPPGLQRSRARLSYRVLAKGSVVERESIPGSKLNWERREGVSVGVIGIKVPRSAAINCVAVYDNSAHHSLWIADPKEFQNPRLTALDTCNCGLELLRNYLLPIERRGLAARNFESAVAWILWAYGLSTAHVGNTDFTKEGPDILATAPNGSIAVVECTLGLLKEESKLAKVARRAISIRDRLVSVGLYNVQVLPILVTSLTRREIEAELDAATEAGVLVLSRENWESALREIVVFPDGDQMFRRGVEALEAAKEELSRKRNQGQLPGL